MFLLLLKFLLLLLLFFYMLFVILLFFMVISRTRLRFKYKEYKLNSISQLIFASYCKLPRNKYFFKNLKDTYFPLSGTILPKLNIDDYDFTDVSISGCTFHKKTIISKDTDFFQKVSDKRLICCTLPVADYSLYNFNGVNIDGVDFRKNSILPEKYDFFTSIDNSDCISAILPKSFYENCHFYDLNKASMILMDRKITVNQYFILYKKYGTKLSALNLKIKDI